MKLKCNPWCTGVNSYWFHGSMVVPDDDIPQHDSLILLYNNDNKNVISSLLFILAPNWTHKVTMPPSTSFILSACWPVVSQQPPPFLSPNSVKLFIQPMFSFKDLLKNRFGPKTNLLRAMNYPDSPPPDCRDFASIYQDLLVAAEYTKTHTSWMHKQTTVTVTTNARLFCCCCCRRCLCFYFRIFKLNDQVIQFSKLFN